MRTDLGEPRPQAAEPPPGGLHVRAVRDADAGALAELIGRVYAEYAGCVLDLPGVDADLSAPATEAARRGGRWWVVTDPSARDAVVATVGTGPRDDDGSLELKRLYVAASHRRRGLGGWLIARVEAQAAGLGATAVTLWSDDRFTDAHRRYVAGGYTATGATRRLHDPSDTTELAFVRPLTAPAPSPRPLPWPTEGPPVDVVALPDGRRLLAHPARGSGHDHRHDHGHDHPHDHGHDHPHDHGHDHRQDHGQDQGPDVEVEVDHAWRVRRVAIGGGGDHAADAAASDRSADRPGRPTRQQLTSDGQGRWWHAGRELDLLRGALGVVVEGRPGLTAIAVGRLRASDEPAGRLPALRFAEPAGSPHAPPLPERVEQHVAHDGDRWVVTTDDVPTTIATR